MLTIKLIGQRRIHTLDLPPVADDNLSPQIATAQFGVAINPLKKVIEAETIEVEMFRCGKLFHISGTVANKIISEYVTNLNEEDLSDFSKDTQFWDVAYIENASGKTVEIVKAC